MEGTLPALFMGLEWLDPQWLLGQFGAQVMWVSLLIIFIECGLLFPFLPGDGLLFALGIFVATEQIDLFPGHRLVELIVMMALLVGAGFFGNVTGYEIGRKIGPRLYARDGRILKRRHFDQTEAFFDKHGNKALVIGRFVAFVRTYITVVAGVTRMERRRFFVWSFVGSLLWVVSITLAGYFLGHAVPWLGDNIDYVVVGIALLSVPLMLVESIRRRRTDSAAAEDHDDDDGWPDRDIAGFSVPHHDTRRSAALPDDS